VKLVLIKIKLTKLGSNATIPVHVPVGAGPNKAFHGVL